MSRVTLPVTLVADDFRFVVRAYSEALFDDVFALCRGSMSDSTGERTDSQCVSVCVCVCERERERE